MAQFEIRRALPQDVQRITEIYNSNTEFFSASTLSTHADSSRMPARGSNFMYLFIFLSGCQNASTGRTSAMFSFLPR